jgi:hypothetical protein
MARARNIKPGFFKNEDLAECSPFARLCFAGLWTMADREGRLEDRPKRIKGELFPYDSIEVAPLLDELERWGFIRRYQVSGERFIFIVKFSDHQTPHGTEKDGQIPDENGMVTVHGRGRNGYITGNPSLKPYAITVMNSGQTPNEQTHTTSEPTVTAGIVNTPANQVVNTALTVNDGSQDGGKNTLIPDSGFLIPDSKEKHSADASQRAPKKSKDEIHDPDFENAWRLYPAREGGNPKAAALKAWRARIREGVEAERLVAATKEFAAAMLKAGNVGTRFVLQGSTFYGPDRRYAEFAPRDDQSGRADSFADAAGQPWWQRAGFDMEWKAITAGCSEKYAYVWRNGARMTDDEILAARDRGEL